MEKKAAAPAIRAIDDADEESALELENLRVVLSSKLLENKINGAHILKNLDKFKVARCNGFNFLSNQRTIGEGAELVETCLLLKGCILIEKKNVGKYGGQVILLLKKRWIKKQTIMFSTRQ